MSATARFRLVASVALRDVLLAELHSLGCLGVEERESELLAYFVADAPSAPVLALAADGVRVIGPEPVPDADWEARWRRGLEPRRVAGLWLRPSWCGTRGAPEIVIDPQQAFGSGEHASTRLAMRLLLDALQPGDRVLDVGTGSGILGLAALRMGAVHALGLDLDPVACRNAVENRARNRLPLALYCGTLDALRADVSCDLVVANLLASRLAPLYARLAAHAGRALVVSGLLAGERDEALASLAGLGLRVEDEASERQSGDLWCALCLAHERARQ